VAFGCDGAASNDAQNLLEAIKLGTILHTVTDGDYKNWLTAEQAVRMATIGGAKGVNLGDCTGSIAAGMDADLVLYNLNHPSLLPRTNPLQLLVLGRPTEVVEAVWVRGRQIVNQGQVLGVDINALHKALQHYPLNLQTAQTQHHPVESHYRKIMLGN
jgi:cytosine/adenosine deaminase-related metal-dependent hydrolase